MATEITNPKCEAKLKKIQEEFEDFVYIVSHDLKSPLRSIKNLSEWIEEDFGNEVPDEAKKNLGIIRNRADEVEKMINGLFELSRVGQTSQCTEPLNFRQLINEIVADLKVEKEVSIEVEAETPEFTANRILIKQVLSHLIDNAIKFNTTESPRVKLSARESGDFIEIMASDNGPGIAPEHHEKVFKIFSSLIPKSQMKNTGIGLTISKKIVESLGGTIEIVKNPNQGTTIRFDWPKIL